MFDFPITEPSIWTAIYCFVFYVIVLLNYRKDAFRPFKKKIGNRKRNAAIVIIGFFIITHCLKGDFFHLMEDIYDYEFVPGEWVSIEKVYYYLAEVLDKNYFLFRTIVWGGAYIAFCYAAKRMKLPAYNAAILLIVTHVIAFSYARASAAMALYFLGLSFLCHPIKRKYISYLIGLVLILLSPNFHTSAWIMVVMTLLIIAPINKWTLLLVSVAIVVIATIVKDYMIIIMNSSETDEYMARKLLRYSEREIEKGLASSLFSVFEYLSFYIPFIFCSFYLLLSHKKEKISKDIFLYYKVVVGLIFMSVVFFVMGSSYVTFFYRILYMTMIPLVIIVGRLYKDRIMKPWQFILSVLIGILFNLMRYTYDIYLIDIGITD